MAVLSVCPKVCSISFGENMALSLATVGGKITAAFINAIIGVVNRQGATAVIPTSVAGTGVTLGAGGKVSFAASTAVSVNGCFTSDFDTYRIEIDSTSSGAAVYTLVERLSGTNAATAYDLQTNATVNATSFPAQSLNQTSWTMNAQAFAGKMNMTIDLYNPALAVATTGLATVGGAANPMTTSAALIQVLFLSHRTTTAYDGFTLTASTGTITGSIRIYGKNNN